MNKPSREDILKVAFECFGNSKAFSIITYESGPYEITEPTIGLKRFAAVMYAKGKTAGFAYGAADMKERAIESVLYELGDTGQAQAICAAIRALSITQTNPVEGEQRCTATNQ